MQFELTITKDNGQTREGPYPLSIYSPHDDHEFADELIMLNVGESVAFGGGELPLFTHSRIR